MAPTPKASSAMLRPTSSKQHLTSDLPPTPPPKDDPFNNNADTFPGKDSDAIYSPSRPRALSRAGSLYSVYSLSRESFSSHLQQLTSIKLPDASSLSQSIGSIESAPKAARTLNDASEDIQQWIQKASKILTGLDAKDDVEWAAAAGKDAIEQVDSAITRFAGLIQVYLTAVEKLQLRKDSGDIPPADMGIVVDRVEKVTRDWQAIKDSLQLIKRQVQLAVEWEDLRNNLFEEAWQEAEGITRQIFEMEEDRHKSTNIAVQKETIAGMDIGDIETILGEHTDNQTRTARISRSVAFPRARSPTSPILEPHQTNNEEDNATLSLYARMQPLRASLDFLPIRISTFEKKGHKVFPSACQDLRDKYQSLEDHWTQLQTDADTLKSEIGEDRWVMIFRNCGRKAMSLIDSVERSIKKLDETLDSNTSMGHSTATISRIENYEAKKVHYCPAIERTISVLDRGVKDRLTVNGEILRLQRDIQQKWRATLADVKNMDSTLEFYDPQKTQQLRDSVSTVLSSDRSFQSSQIDSLGSSPPSSVEGASRDTSRNRSETPSTAVGHDRTTSISTDRSSTPASRRHSHLPIPVSLTPPAKLAPVPQKTPLTRSSAAGSNRSVSSPVSRYSPSVYTPAKSTRSTPSSASSQKPRWNVSVSMNGTKTGHNFKPLAVTEPSPYARPPVKKQTPNVRHTSSSLRPSPSMASVSASPIGSRRPSTQGQHARTPSISPSASTTTSRLSSLKTGTRRPSSLLMGTPSSVGPVGNSPYSPESPLAPTPPRPESRSMLPRPASRAGGPSAGTTPAKKTSTLALRNKK